MMRDAGKTMYTANITKAVYKSQWEDRFPVDEVLYVANRLRLVVRGDGTIVLSDAPDAGKQDKGRPRGNQSVTSAATGVGGTKSALFGYNRADLEGMNILELVDAISEAVSASKYVSLLRTRTCTQIPPAVPCIDASR